MNGDIHRIERERKTLANMIEIFCSGSHGCPELCPDCSELLHYSMTRLDRCPNAKMKPTCNVCPTHCYDPVHRERIKSVMRYSGPRMLLKHPIQAMRHLADELNTPKKKYA